MHDATRVSWARNAHAVFGTPARGALDVAPWLAVSGAAGLSWPLLTEESLGVRVLIGPLLAVMLALPVCWAAANRRARRALELTAGLALLGGSVATRTVEGALTLLLAVGLVILMSALVTSPILLALARAAHRPAARDGARESLLLGLYGAATLSLCRLYEFRHRTPTAAALLAVGALTVLVVGYGVWNDLRARAVARAVLRGEVPGWRVVEAPAAEAGRLLPSPWLRSGHPWRVDAARVLVNDAPAVSDTVYRQPQSAPTPRIVMPASVEPAGPMTALLLVLATYVAVTTAPAVAALTR